MLATDTAISNDELVNALLQPAAAPATTPGSSEKPVKVRKKPGRKPNPASPALRKAQNREAQRAFRERKARHLRELEAAITEMRQEQEQLQAENERLSHDSDVLRCENWYLKGTVLTLQLVCLRHNLVIPPHGPYMTEEVLALLAQSIPEPIAAYVSANANNKPPVLSHWQKSSASTTAHASDPMSPRKPCNRLSSGSIVITQDGIHSPHPTKVQAPRQFADNTSRAEHQLNVPLPALFPVLQQQQPAAAPQACSKHQDTTTSNLTAIQILRLGLGLQSVCQQMNAQHFAIQPTVLQLTIPHDPRIDLIPSPNMRDRMILFRDLFDLDDCFHCLIDNSVFHGGDPTVASNWQLPAEFFDKFWFLTTDFSLQRITNAWRKAEGLDKLQPDCSGSLPDMSELASLFLTPSAEPEKTPSPTTTTTTTNSSISISSAAADIFCSPIHLTTSGYSTTTTTGKAQDTDFVFGDLFGEDHDVTVDTTYPPCEDVFIATPSTDNDYDILMENFIGTDNIE